MKNFREVNDDILKEWLEFREENILCYLTEEDKKHKLFIDEIYEKVLKNVPQQNKKYVEKQLNELEKNFMAYLSYWNEKYYRNGFVDGVQMATGCFDEKWSSNKLLHFNRNFFFYLLIHQNMNLMNNLNLYKA